MVVSDDVLITQIVDAQPEAVLWFKPVWELDSSGEAVITDFEVRYCNHAAGRMLYASREKVIGQRIHATGLVDDASKHLVFSQCLQVWNTGEQLSYTYHNQHLGAYFHVMRSRIKDGIFSVTRDISEAVRSGEQLEQQAALLNSILDASVQALMALEAVRDETGTIWDFRFLKVNPSFARLMNTSEAALQQHTFRSFFPAVAGSGLFELNCRVIESATPVRREILIGEESNGTWYDISMSPLGGNGLVVSFTDITEIKQDKQAIRASAEYLQTVIDSSQTGITLITPERDASGTITDFRYRAVNSTFSRFVGATPAQMAGRLLSEWFPQYKAQGTLDRYCSIFESGTSQRFDLHYTNGGHDLWMDVLATRQGNEILVTWHDYTPLKKAQLEGEALVAELKRSNTSLEEFAYAASHDLQEPLRKIQFFCDRLRSQYEPHYDAEGLALFGRMDAAAQRMRNLIEDLLSFSKISSLPRRQEPVQLEKVMEEVVGDLEATIQEKGALIHREPLPEVTGDRGQLHQLFQNLLSNALKYARKEVTPEVSVRCRKLAGGTAEAPGPAPEYFRIDIQDNGIGFEQEEAERIFQVFQRLHGRTEYSGTGVGLAIARKVAENHNGLIRAEGRPGAGAVFTVWLPVTGGEPTRQP
ncbi:MAG TPA: ATP-binding protein [Chitinophagaceae bacterium]|jgi:signal transduction histidine kinase|nr:ATP-binding protein [Chitinophagaceae bacterium]